MIPTNVLEAFFTGVAVLIMMAIWNKLRRPKVWVIEDSPGDTQLFKMNIKLDNCDIRYMDTIKGIRYKMFSPPDVVICDYYLKDRVNGDQVRAFFERNNIPVIIVTGMEGDIKGIPSEAVVHKSIQPSYFREVEKRVRLLTVQLKT